MISMNRKVRDWQELQFGMFIHFGLYSLAGGVWKGKRITRGYSEQILSHGYLPQADYERLTEGFSLEGFDAGAIVALAKEAGMRYLVVTTKHHDGFCLFETKTTDYNSTNAACRMDIVKALSEACKSQGLAFGIYYSWIDWHFPLALPISAHNSDAIPQEHQAYNIAQLTELFTNYGPICELWMDMGAPTKEQSEEVYALVQRLQSQCMVNGRIWNDCGDFLTMGDNKLPTVNLSMPWQTPASIYHETWGYREWQQRGNLEEKIQELSDTARAVVAQGGNYLLNIGLMGDGSVEPFEQKVLQGIGKSLRAEGLKRDSLLPDREPAIREEIEVGDQEGNEGKRTIKTERNKALPLPTLLNPDTLVLPSGSPSYRYTGSEYYSYRPIVTSLSWTVEVPQEHREADKEANGGRAGKGGIPYEIRWVKAKPLSEELKLCLAIDGKTFLFSLQKERSEDVIVGGMELPGGVHTITLQTVGDALKRPELKNTNITVKFTKKEETHEH